MIACSAAPAQNRASEPLADYFRAKTVRLAEGCLPETLTLAEWKAKRSIYRDQLFEMLGLSPLPTKTDLKAVTTGVVDQELFSVEKIHFQSMPGLYVTGNLYVPKSRPNPLPAILYVCGHGRVATNGVSYGNKTAYEHHGSWFARNGYVCLMIDTIQLGEIEGLHHGTYRENMWWWNARGYTPAGVEAWNCIRALDYLQSRPEVNPEKLGVTGRSGGGAYSWWITALDDRIKVAAPVAGITDLHNHVVDGTVEGHCDCMFMVNTFGWDYALVAALAAPRPLLIANSDKDSIFPLDGVSRLHRKVAKVYQLYGASTNLGLLITEGPHKDTQDLQLPVFRWFNRHLKGVDPVIEMAATHLFTPDKLKVFETLPGDERTSRIHETFVPLARNEPPATPAAWSEEKEKWMTALREKVFRAWPANRQAIGRTQMARPVAPVPYELKIIDFETEPGLTLRAYVVQPSDQASMPNLTMRVLDQTGWTNFVTRFGPRFPGTLSAERASIGLGAESRAAISPAGPEAGAVFLAPRGIGLTAWQVPERKEVQIRRRFNLLGETLDSGRVFDIVQAARILREEQAGLALNLESSGTMAVNALYASLFLPGVSGLRLEGLPVSHRSGPDYLNVLRFLDIPQALAMAAEKSHVELMGAPGSDWSFARATAANLGWKDRLSFSLLAEGQK